MMTEKISVTTHDLAEDWYESFVYFADGWSKPKRYRKLRKRFGTYGEIPSHQAYIRESVNLSYFLIMSHMAALMPQSKYYEFIDEFHSLIEGDQRVVLDRDSYNDYEGVWNEASVDESDQSEETLKSNPLYMLARRAAERSVESNKQVGMIQIMIFHSVVCSIMNIVKAMQHDFKNATFK